MLTKIEVTKTYWVGMTTEQRAELAIALTVLCSIDEKILTLDNTKGLLTLESIEVLNDLRQAILNV